MLFLLSCKHNIIMRESPAKMLIQLLLIFILLLMPEIKATPAPMPSADETPSFYSENGFISSPSIYSYTIENQIPTNQTTTVYHQAQSFTQNSQKPSKQLSSYLKGSINRNLYYTSSDSNLNTNVLSGSRRASVSSSTASTTTTSSSSTSAALTSSGMEPTQPAPISDCTLDRLAVYKVVLHTYWTRDLFPKHYPDWRPTAQWTKTLV